MEPDYNKVRPELESMLSLSNKEFKNQFGDMAGSWRGKKPLQRNSIIALANYRDRTSVPTLLKLIDTDSRPMIRGTAAWAIAKIMRRNPNEELITFLEMALEKESELETISEFEQAIEELKRELYKY